MNMNDIIGLLWGAKEILRGDYAKSRWGEIILPFVVLRRLELILEPTKNLVIKEYINLKSKISNENIIDERLNLISKQYFHNHDQYNLELLLGEPANIHKNLRKYISSFSQNIQEIFNNFEFKNTVDSLHSKSLLFQIVQHFAKAPLDPITIDNHRMGTIYEELIRKSSEASNQDAGEFFTPREVIKLMVNLLFANEIEAIKQKHIIRTLYDPAAGTGGMLSVASEYIHSINPHAYLDVFGQELNEILYAICKSDMMIKGYDLNRIRQGNSLTDQDRFPNEKFHYMLSNPPFGVDWGKKYGSVRLREMD